MVAQVVKNLPAMQETWVQSLGMDNPLEGEIATHSSILAWKIPGTEVPGRLWSRGWPRIGHYWATNTYTLHVSLLEYLTPNADQSQTLPISVHKIIFCNDHYFLWHSIYYTMNSLKSDIMTYLSLNTGVSCHFLLQRIFVTPASNLHLLWQEHEQVDSLPLSHWGSLFKSSRSSALPDFLVGALELLLSG